MNENILCTKLKEDWLLDLDKNYFLNLGKLHNVHFSFMFICLNYQSDNHSLYGITRGSCTESPKAVVRNHPRQLYVITRGSCMESPEAVVRNHPGQLYGITRGSCTESPKAVVRNHPRQLYGITRGSCTESPSQLYGITRGSSDCVTVDTVSY